jgi:hypothetical protein
MTPTLDVKLYDTQTRYLGTISFIQLSEFLMDG